MNLHLSRARTLAFLPSRTLSLVMSDVYRLNFVQGKQKEKHEQKEKEKNYRITCCVEYAQHRS